MALGSFTEMGFLRTSDFREGNEMVFFLMKLAFRENGIVVEKVDFKLSKIAIEVNYKENVSWSFRSLGSGSLGKGGDSLGIESKNLTKY